jgi:hypothetical protein
MRLTAQQLRERYSELRDIVNEWDPVDLIADGAPVEEYDCLVGPVLRRLEEHQPASAIAEYLMEAFGDHFGVPLRDPGNCAQRAIAWYSEKWPNTESTPIGDAL